MIRASRAVAFLLVLTDLACVAGAFSAGYVLRFQYDWLAFTPVSEPPPFRDYAEALILVTAIFLLVFKGRGLYRDLHPRGIDVLQSSLGALSLAAVGVLAASFFYREFSYSRSACLIACGLLAFTLPLPRLVLLAYRRRRYLRGLDLIPAVIVGSTSRVSELVQALQKHTRYGLDVIGVLSDVEQDAGTVLGPISDLERVVGERAVREVLIPDTLGRLELLELLELCSGLEVEVRIIPQIYDLFVTPGDLTELHGVPFVAIREERSDLGSLFVKRVFDLIVGFILLTLALPLILCCALLIRRESPGPAIFVQRRVGRGGRVFDMWKLRSMVADAETRRADLVDLESLEQPVYKLADDPRVTRVGRSLRRWSLDELPQLWNVVRGNMSLVGPRPEEESVVALYDAHQRRRLKAKPGLTGLQQIEARASTDLDERVRLDVYYLRKQSFLLDLWILARTPWAVLHGRGAR